MVLDSEINIIILEIRRDRSGKELTMKFKSLALLLIELTLVVSSTQCNGSGSPTIDRFILRYDIVAATDGTQSADWNALKASNVEISVLDENNSKVWSQSGLPANSNGLHTVPIQSLQPGKYWVVLDASNSVGHTTDKKEFLLVDASKGLWYSFTKYVNGPAEAWYGFSNEVVPVTTSQGLSNEKDVISVSEHVKFRSIRWFPAPGMWVDRQCTNKEMYNIMTIRQLTYSHVYNKYDLYDPRTQYTFPEGEWKVVGQYYCSVDWRPCDFGWNGGTQVYKQVAFTLELEAIGY
jgi:hypothetical protein